MDEKTLLAAIARCGWKGVSQQQLDGLRAKLNLLQARGRYQRLLANIRDANDRDNFLASVLEATVAFQFESAGIELRYEVRQEPHNASSIDLSWRTASGLTIYIELRLLQQDRATADSIQRQLDMRNVWEIIKDGVGERQDIIRTQQAILEKVQLKDGTPTKFLRNDVNSVNIVAIVVSDIVLGMFDAGDCRLVTHGDPAVPPFMQRGIFGLFQDAKPEYPDHIQKLAARYAQVRDTLHAVLFLFKEPKMELFHYSVERCLEWNPKLVDAELATRVRKQIELAIPLRKS